jgi:hypothetical protein
MGDSDKRKGIRLRRGDLFEFSVLGGQYGYGLIVIPGGVLYAIFFRGLHFSRPDITFLLADEVALVGTTMDSLFYHRHWTVIAHDQPLPAEIPYPNWKVKIGDEVRTVDFDGANNWPIRSDEIDILDYQFSRAPLGYQDALEALNGLREWEEHFEKLTPAYAARRETRPRASPPLSLRAK